MSPALIAQLSGPIDEGRVSIWSAHPDEQAIMQESAFAGSQGRQVQAGNDAFAVYLNDLTGAKMDTYLDVDIETSVAACREDERRDIAVAVTLASTAPADAGSIYPMSVTGGGTQGVPAGEIGTLVAVSAPSGTFIGGVTHDGELVYSVSGERDSLVVTSVARRTCRPASPRRSCSISSPPPQATWSRRFCIRRCSRAPQITRTRRRAAPESGPRG